MQRNRENNTMGENRYLFKKIGVIKKKNISFKDGHNKQQKW